MILNFTCSNYRSILKEVCFSMCATSDQENIEQVKKVNSINVLRNAAIYGANGSGKSSLISAIAHMRYLIINSVNLQPGDKIARTPHKLADSNEPTVFCMQFVNKGKRYLYGISYVDDMIKEEYLYYYPNGRQAKIFDRDEKGITYGESFKKVLKQVSENMLKQNKLLLSCAANYSNLKETEEIFLFFKENIVIYQNAFAGENIDDNWLRYSLKGLMNSEKIKGAFLSFLQSIDTDIKDIRARYDLKEIDVSEMPDNLPEKLKELLSEGATEEVEIKLDHDKFVLNVSEESEGIRKIFRILGPIIDVIVNGKTLIFDEIETSLHPSIVRQIIDLFIKTKKEEFAQLIFSTHNAMLLDLDIFRRDQIWFTELNREYHATDLYSLSEIKNVRKDENIMKGYILGKYGAIPMVNKELIQIFGED